MNDRIFPVFLLVLQLAAPAAFAENLFFNGSMALAADGYALRRNLRTDTNPKLEFIPLRTEAGALIVDDPYAEGGKIFCREIPLKAATRYRFTAETRATAGTLKAEFQTVNSHADWHQFDGPLPGSPQWRRGTVEFTTRPGETRYFSPRFNLNARGPGRFELRNLRLEEVGDTAPDRPELSITLPRKLYVHDFSVEPELRLSATLRVSNPSSVPFQRTVKILLHDDHFTRRSVELSVPVDLAPGTSAEYPAGFRVDRFGAYRMSAVSDRWKSLDGFFTVMGEYRPQPVDLRRDFVMSANGGTGYLLPPEAAAPAYRVNNAPLETQFELLARSGIRLIREHDDGWDACAWKVVEPEPGRFDFSHLDRTLAWYRKYHIELLPIFGRTHFVRMSNHLSLPGWLNAPLQQNDPPGALLKFRKNIFLPDPAAWARYCGAVAAHLRNRVQACEVMNEPCLFLAPAVYGTYLKAAAEAIRGNAPEMFIAAFCDTGDFSRSVGEWAEQCLRLGQLAWADAVGFHPYGSRELGSTFPADRMIREFRQMVNRYGGAAKPIWNTELYYTADWIRPRFSPDFYRADENAVRYLTDLGEGVKQGISIHLTTFWVPLLSPHIKVGPNNPEWIPGENAVMFNALARWFEGAEPLAKFRLEPDTVCYVYRRRDRSLIAAVWNYGRLSGLAPGWRNIRVMDLYGNPLTPAEAAISSAPLFCLPEGIGESEFLKQLKQTTLEWKQPFLPARVVRKVGDTRWITLRNRSKKTASCTLRLNGGKGGEGKGTVAGGASAVLRFPVRDAAPVTSISFSGSEEQFPVREYENPVIRAGEIIRIASPDGVLKVNGTIRVRAGRAVCRFRVEDTTRAGVSPLRAPWQTDSLELFLDFEPQNLPLTGAENYTAETIRLFLLPEERGAGQFVLDSLSLRREEFRWKVSRDSVGYTAECSFPLRNNAESLGFAVRANDAESSRSTATRSAQWGTGPLQRNRCGFGIVVLR